MSKDSRRLRFAYLPIILFVLSTLTAPEANAQGGQTLFGEVKVDETDKTSAPHSILVILYRDGGGEIGRQSVSNRSRYRFINLLKGDYQLAVEVDNNEIARLRIVINDLSPSPYGFQQDLILALKPRMTTTKGAVVSTAELYNRSANNRSLFRKAQEAAEQKKFDEAVSFLKRIVEADKSDFQAWTLLGTVYFVKGDFADADKAYSSAIEANPTFTLALLDLGKLRSSQQKYEAAIEPLTRALEAQSQSAAEANLLLGEAYLKLKQGSKAVPYLNEAAKLGRPEAHLLLGWLYDTAGMKDKAVTEYEEFLKKKPDYADRKRLLEYIAKKKS
jgi:tetratricopeptide (TPR) repeat protein